jgi:hypothetical protein
MAYPLLPDGFVKTDVKKQIDDMLSDKYLFAGMNRFFNKKFYKQKSSGFGRNFLLVYSLDRIMVVAHHPNYQDLKCSHTHSFLAGTHLLV